MYQGGATTTRHYIGNIEYNGTTRDILHHEEGYVDLATNTYHYYLKDHLGNTRVVFKNTAGSAEVVQRNDYYPFGMNMTSWHSGTEHKYKYNGKELQDEELDGIGLDWYDYGFRFYDPSIGRWHVIDPMIEKHYDYTPYAYTYNNPVLFIDVMGLDTNIYVFDQAERPADDGTDENTYTADIYVVGDDGTVLGVYKGSSYPNSISNENNATQWRTVNEGEHSYHNKNGHTPASTLITEKGLNIDDDNNNNTRTAPGTNPQGESITMDNVNVHEGHSNNGNATSRGSHGCVTIKPSDANAFFDNFDWSGTNGVTGNTSGTITIYRGGGTATKGYLDMMKNIQNIGNIGVVAPTVTIPLAN